MNEEKVTVIYSCSICGLENSRLEMDARKPEEDIGDWMEKLQLSLGMDHNKKSPFCKAGKLSEVKIPIQGEYVGAPDAPAGGEQ